MRSGIWISSLSGLFLFISLKLVIYRSLMRSGIWISSLSGLFSLDSSKGLGFTPSLKDIIIGSVDGLGLDCGCSLLACSVSEFFLLLRPPFWLAPWFFCGFSDSELCLLRLPPALPGVFRLFSDSEFCLLLLPDFKF